ncbi:MAG: polymerase subunit beta, partial [Gaiellaceae bacterium]|nr:polymerase subunit beta [Gaiellaceae bacterium]
GGVLLRAAGGNLEIAATDMELSLRLSADCQVEGEGAVVAPGRLLVELARIASSGDEVEVGVHENQVIFATSGVWLTTRRIDGQFPNYKQLLPEAFEYELTVPRIELLEVVKRASVMIQRSTPLQIRFAEGELTVIARTHEVGESQESMPVAFTGDTLEMGFNADFLRDGLESLEGDDVRVKLISPLRPAVIQGDGDDFTYLVMPIRLPG